MSTPGSCLVCAEFYKDATLINLVGAVDVPAKRMIEATQTIGKAICRALASTPWMPF